jgi:uncharacterized protein
MGKISTLYTLELPSGSSVSVYRRRFGNGNGPRVVFTAGIRGDAPEGIRVAHTIAEFLEKNKNSLDGTVDIYPCVNPLAAEQGRRLWPFFEVDINRMFPGNSNGHPPAQVAHALVSDIKGADLVIELRGARPGFSEIPQALVRSGNVQSIKYALASNVSLVWQRNPGPSATLTFAYQFQNSIILEGGRGNQLTKKIGDLLLDGCLNIISLIGILPEDKLPFHWTVIERPKLLSNDDVFRLRVNRAGLFLPSCTLRGKINKGDEIGRVLEPATGVVRENIISPVEGFVMALRSQPVVSPGIMVARVCKET